MAAMRQSTERIGCCSTRRIALPPLAIPVRRQLAHDRQSLARGGPRCRESSLSPVAQGYDTGLSVAPSERYSCQHLYYARRCTLLTGAQSLLAIHGRLEHTDVRQVAILLRVVEAVADDEAVGNVEAQVGRLDHLVARLRFIQQRADAHAGWAALLQALHQIAQREAGVYDVLDDQHVLPRDRRLQILEDAYDTAGFGAVAVAADRHEIQLQRILHLAAEGHHEPHGALEEAQQQHVFSAVNSGDRRRQLADARLQLLRADQDLFDVVVQVVGDGHRANLPLPQCFIATLVKAGWPARATKVVSGCRFSTHQAE